MRKLLIPAACASVLMLAPQLASAAVMTHFGRDLGGGENVRLTATPEADRARAAFMSRITGGFAESFEAIADGTHTWVPSTPGVGRQDKRGNWWAPRQFDFATTIGDDTDPFSATIAADTGTVIDVPSGTNGYGRYPTDGSKVFHSGAATVTIEFDRPVHGFGFDAIDIGDFAGELTIDVYDGDRLAHATTISHALNGLGGDALFFGLIDEIETFTKVVFGNTKNGDEVFAIDHLTVATVVTPVPAALPLLATGFGALAWLRRRRAVRS